MIRLTDDPSAPVLTVATAPARDPQTVTRSGTRLEEPIDGVETRRAVTQEDSRGSIVELFDPAWGFTDDPLVYAYQVTIRPGIVKGWVVHLEQDDRLFFSFGSFRIALYDARQGSPTHGRGQILFFGELNRTLLRIPAGVFHAVRNVGERDALMLNFPTKPYRRERPDKYRLPLDSPEIPIDP
jgi:dTDP-4-dehydrorhamnose 3,5-epimerase